MDNNKKDEKAYKVFAPEPEEPKEPDSEPERTEPIGDFRKKNDYQLSLEEEVKEG